MQIQMISNNSAQRRTNRSKSPQTNFGLATVKVKGVAKEALKPESELELIAYLKRLKAIVFSDNQNGAAEKYRSFNINEHPTTQEIRQYKKGGRIVYTNKATEITLTADAHNQAKFDDLSGHLDEEYE